MEHFPAGWLGLEGTWGREALGLCTICVQNFWQVMDGVGVIFRFESTLVLGEEITRKENFHQPDHLFR
jgi:hypothetical protein